MGDQSFLLLPTSKFSKMEREALREEKVMGQTHSQTTPLLNAFIVLHEKNTPFCPKIYNSKICRKQCKSKSANTFFATACIKLIKGALNCTVLASGSRTWQIWLIAVAFILPPWSVPPYCNHPKNVTEAAWMPSPPNPKCDNIHIGAPLIISYLSFFFTRLISSAKTAARCQCYVLALATTYSLLIFVVIISSNVNTD